MKRCVTCNKLLKVGHGHHKAEKYCSYKCYQAKTPLMFKVEKEFNSTIENLMLESESMECSQTLKAYSLGVNRGTYRKWKEKFAF